MWGLNVSLRNLSSSDFSRCVRGLSMMDSESARKKSVFLTTSFMVSAPVESASAIGLRHEGCPGPNFPMEAANLAPSSSYSSWKSSTCHCGHRGSGLSILRVASLKAVRGCWRSA